MRISDWSSDVCSSDLGHLVHLEHLPAVGGAVHEAEVRSAARVGEGAVHVGIGVVLLRAALELVGGSGAVSLEEVGAGVVGHELRRAGLVADRKSTRLNSSH